MQFKNMQNMQTEICKTMPKNAMKNAIICGNMQKQIRQYAFTCWPLKFNDMQCICNYMKLYVDICDGNYMQKYAKNICTNMRKYANYMQ